MKRLFAASGIAAFLALGACTDTGGGSMKAMTPIPPKTMALMSEKRMGKSDPILVRVFKKESELEVWKKVDGQYAHLKTFPICRWSGQLGPKVREGDRQAPEGFYSITPAQMNPNSAYYLSFNTGYPNAFDRTHGRTGAHLMVHGTCSSMGCYAMTDDGIAEVYAIAREAFAGGQKSFQFQAYPFRMTADNLARYRQDPNMAFWKNLKQGSDHFEITRREPSVGVCQGRYAFDTVGDGCKDDPTLAAAVAQKDDADRRHVADLVAKGVPAVRLVYQDGSGHGSFTGSEPSPSGDSGSALALLDARPRPNLGTVSRPEALAAGPREVAMDTSSAKPVGKAKASLAALASAEAKEPAARDKPGRTRVASADPDAPITTASTPVDQPLYERMISGVLGGGTATSEAPVAAAAQVATAAPKHDLRSAKAKQTDPTGAKATAAKAAKPQAAITKPTERHADSSRLLSRGDTVGPATTAFRLN